jgi:nitrogenase molybdenum-iron protein beta chain
MFPDTSDVLDAPQTGKHEFYPKGGATVARDSHSGRQPARWRWAARRSRAPGAEENCEVRAEVLELPIGLQATDRFINALRHRDPASACPDSSPTNAAAWWT